MNDQKHTAVNDRVPRDARELRGEETRRKLLAAGLSVFAAQGYDGVTTREIAAKAGANQAAIPYHFGGKQQLYVAVAHDVAERGRASFDVLLKKPQSVGETSPEAALAGLSAALDVMVRGLLNLSDEGSAAAFILREQTHPGHGFAPLYDGYIRPLHEHITTLVARATNRSPRATDTIVDAHALIGMALAFAVSRETLLRRTGWKDFGSKRVDRISARVAQLACHALAAQMLAPVAPPTPHETRR